MAEYGRSGGVWIDQGVAWKQGFPVFVKVAARKANAGSVQEAASGVDGFVD